MNNSCQPRGIRTPRLLLIICCLLLPPVSGRVSAEEVSFARQIRPLLAQHCFACHGPDAEDRQADLRLDLAEPAKEAAAIVPGKPEESELYVRITSEDPDHRMPPADAGEPLTSEQQELIRKWLLAGGEYEQHWAFVIPERPAFPDASPSTWARSPLDTFIRSRMQEVDLSPSSEAGRYQLVRRVYLDLIGIPPTPEEADAFVKDEHPLAFERLVDTLLASPQYGERWARPWLDLARYSDTNGYEKDRPRSIWPYRDWVIQALNADLPYDQFSIQQLAGDMLPEATLTQRTATGFHRNTMLNEEGGIDPLEYRYYAMVDRVATTSTIWLGLTMGCAQCHTHKYDPITHSDYYGFMALLNNASEPDLTIQDAGVERRRQVILDDIARSESGLREKFPLAVEGQDQPQDFEPAFREWETKTRNALSQWRVLRPTKLETNLPKLDLLEDGSIFSRGDVTKRDEFQLRVELKKEDLPVAALRLEVLPDERLPAGGPGRAFYEGRKGDFFLSEFGLSRGDMRIAFAGGKHSYGKISIGSGDAKPENVYDGDGSTGWSTSGREGQPHQLVLHLAQPIREPGEVTLSLLFERHFAASLGRFRFSVSSHEKAEPTPEVAVEVSSLLRRERETWSAEQRRQVEREFLLRTPLLAEARKPINDLQSKLPDLPWTMVMQERKSDNPRVTFRHHRGEFLSPKETVTPSLPRIFTADDTNAVENRLDLATWLVSPRNPLAARVTVNRAWRALFGRGLMQTSGDFGTQSDPPSHPLLLDWLAAEFVESGWSLKKLHRQIVLSSAYRQDSRVTPEGLAQDPGNLFLARGPRHRLDAEVVRDLLLSASGLLSLKQHGPSVYPPQPASVTALAYGGTKWPTSTGEARYRRSLYTFSKRTAPFAAFRTFDAPTGETCVPRRDRSNTPLQALTLLNDEMFMEMARALARRTQADSQQEWATNLFRACLTRPPEAEELVSLLEFQNTQRERMKTDALDPTLIAGDEAATPEFAAWVLSGRALMNVDETISKQ